MTDYTIRVDARLSDSGPVAGILSQVDHSLRDRVRSAVLFTRVARDPVRTTVEVEVNWLAWRP